MQLKLNCDKGDTAACMNERQLKIYVDVEATKT